ncbi:HpcH/HpaI aldolase family protein [Microbaculum sp. FT89]|uniref:HpcH/HpaI aldolase family protein n=1 Tax=Microbaculum sp. FT89 TaxID=3447298 RepID=UPI003F52B8C8
MAQQPTSAPAALRARLGTGPALRGPFVSIPSPVSVEILCTASPDFLCLEGEHAALRGPLLADMLRAADLGGVPALVRVPEAMPWLIAEALDAGACGILAPRIASADQARAVVRAARFPPEGQRGAGPGRATRYGYAAARYVEQARGETLVAVQIETVDAIAELDSILAVPGMDLIFIGPGDLGISLAAAGRPGPEALAAAIDEIVVRTRAAGIQVGLFTATAPRPAPDPRLALYIQGGDAMFLQAAAQAAFQPKQ